MIANFGNGDHINLTDHTDLFTKSKGTDKYICPICGGNDLSIHKSGKYYCYSSAGDCNKEIYKYAVDRLGINSSNNQHSTEFKPTKVGIDFYSSDLLSTASKSTYEDLINYQSGKIPEVRFSYQNLESEQCYVIRKDYPDNAKSKPHTVKDGQLRLSKFDKPWYPFNHHSFPLAKGKSILITEGEKDATVAQYSTGILSTCLACGGSKYEKEFLFLELQRLNIKSAFYFYDNDEAGKNKATELKAIADKLEFDLIIIPITELYPNCHSKADIADYFLDENISDYLKSKSHLESIVNKFKSEQCSMVTSFTDKDNNNNFEEEINWFDKATEELFSGEWICLADKLYRYNGNIYEEIEEGEIIKRINHWCSNYVDNKGKRNKATPSSVRSIHEWVRQKFYISPKQVNCAGIPLKNGYLAINHEGKIKFELKPYSPLIYFTYQSEVTYNPLANANHASKLLECLDEPYKSLFIESLSTILGFDLIRKRWDRVKALMLIGDGSNGKDTLREVISLILGKNGMTGCTLNDFSQGDNARGFNLLRLATNPKLNWSSENKQINIDRIQTLKQAISGDPIFIEPKGKDGFEIELNTLFIFNTNDKPDIQANQKAISSRLTLIPFTKTYSTNPKKGELKANARFKHDKEFLIKEVCPAFLNLLIASFSNVLDKGINYELAEGYFEEIITENNHLRRFAKDIGLTYTGNDEEVFTVGELYSFLLEWYHEKGYCHFEDVKGGKMKKTVWDCEMTKNDPIVTHSRFLKNRVLAIFPQIKVLETSRSVTLQGLAMWQG